MTSIVMMRFEDRVGLYSDTMGYDASGIVKMFTPKVFTLLPQRALFGYRGPVVAGQFYHMHAVQHASFDALLKSLRADVEYAARMAHGLGNPLLLMVNVAGWSDMLGGFIMARCGMDADQVPRPALELIESQFASDPPLVPERMKDFLQGESFYFDGETTIIKWFEAQRATNYDIPGGQRGCLIGGAIQHTWLTAAGEAGSRFLHHWPDVVGSAIVRAPVEGPRDEFEAMPWGAT